MLKKQFVEWNPDVILSFMTKTNLVVLLAKILQRSDKPVVIAERANPYNAKFFIEKPFENFCKKAAQDKEFRNSIRFIHKGRKITIDESIKELKSNKLENFKKEISENCFCDSNGLLQGLKKAKSLIKL